jgi:hypothetical protein
MKKTPKRKRPITAESIARLAEKGNDVSAYFTNQGKMMKPLQTDSDQKTPSEAQNNIHSLDDYRRCTRKLIDQVHQMGLVSEFFFVFSRFEHALSTTNYLSGGKKGVSPNWDKFAREMNDVFQLHLPQEVRRAIRYYEEAPPKKQVVDSGRLTWKDVVPETNYPLEKLLRLVRRVKTTCFTERNWEFY